VSLVLRKGDVGFNNPTFEATYQRREELAWPIPRTQYTKYHLHADGKLSPTLDNTVSRKSYKALGSLGKPEAIQFSTEPFEHDIEITGHAVARLSISTTPAEDEDDNDIDIFVTLRYLSPHGNEVHYTGTAGDPVPLTKGWLRVSLRKIDESNPKNRPYLPHRNYFSSDVQKVEPEKIYTVDVELWPTNVIAEKGGCIVFEVSSGDTQGSGIFEHKSQSDRPVKKFAGLNHLNFAKGKENYLILPIVPEV